MINRGGLDLAMAAFAAELPKHKGSVPEREEVEICVAGISPTKGPVLYTFRTTDEEGFVEAYKLYESKAVVCGIEPPPAALEFLKDGLKAKGVEFVEFFRTEKSKTNGLDGDHYVIGGHLDWSILDASGLRTERIKVWDDRIGEKIDPFASTRTVVTMPAMNRKQRRAAAKAKAA